MEKLMNKKCVPCRGDEPTLSDEEIQDHKQEVPEWEVVAVDGTKRLKRQFKFGDFQQALDFTVKVGGIAEEEDHHPVLVTEWGKVTVTWWTHKIHGLHQNDIIMAAKTDELYSDSM